MLMSSEEQTYETYETQTGIDFIVRRFCLDGQIFPMTWASPAVLELFYFSSILLENVTKCPG